VRKAFSKLTFAGGEFVMIKVLVWQNYWGPAAYRHPGHVALAIMAGNMVEQYISWWPAETDPNNQRTYRPGHGHDILKDHQREMSDGVRTRLANGNITARPNQTNDNLVVNQGIFFENPSSDWLQKPDLVIDLPTIDDAQNQANGIQQLGLCEDNLRDWWKIYSSKELDKRNVHHQYKFVSTRFNCASVAMAGLLVAGCKLFSAPADAWFYYSPNDVRDYAEKVRTKIGRVNNQAGQIQAGILGEYRKYMPQTRQQYGVDYLYNTGGQSRRVVDIWRTEEWRRQSAVRIGRRKEQVARIDDLMVRYWAEGDEWTPANVLGKVTLLADILIQVQDHLIQKPKSDRREAVLKLGSQCIMVVRHRATDYQDYIDNFINTTF
jgi:hypothetical protein